MVNAYIFTIGNMADDTNLLHSIDCNPIKELSTDLAILNQWLLGYKIKQKTPLDNRRVIPNSDEQFQTNQVKCWNHLGMMRT